MADAILANAKAMAPAIAARSEEIEGLRRLPEDLVADLRNAGFFRMGRSREKGGPQMTLPQHLEVIEILARADSSVGWCVKIGTDSGLLAEYLPPTASARLLPHPDMITAGQFTTAHGKLERVEGGYVLTGRFPFGSGVTHADVVMSGGVLVENGEPVIGPSGMPEGRLAFCRADEIVIVAEPELASLRNAKNLVDLSRAPRPNDAVARLVLNRVGVPKRPEINAGEFSKALGIDVLSTIPFDAQLFGTAANNGQMIAEVQAGSKATEAFTQIASMLTGRGEAKRSRRSLLEPFVAKLKRRKAS